MSFDPELRPARRSIEYLKNYIDHRDEKIGRKIRDAEVKKTPFMLIVGEKEQAEEKVSARKHGEGDLGVFKIGEFVELFKSQLEY